jgi:imidazolonepropionase-like amidohydrolase
MEERALATVDASRESVAKAREAGIRIAVGTDPGHGETFVDECRTLHNAGLTPMEVVVAATRTGAELVKMQDQLGTLEQGKIADLVVLDDNPLEDINAFGNVGWVVKEGKVIKSPEK